MLTSVSHSWLFWLRAGVLVLTTCWARRRYPPGIRDVLDMDQESPSKEANTNRKQNGIEFKEVLYRIGASALLWRGWWVNGVAGKQTGGQRPPRRQVVGGQDCGGWPRGERGPGPLPGLERSPRRVDQNGLASPAAAPQEVQVVTSICGTVCDISVSVTIDSVGCSLLIHSPPTWTDTSWLHFT